LGGRWHPYQLPREFEITPLLAWDRENTKWIGLTSSS
jgi:hypothetical protein